jgi:hypothetical protein
MKLSSVEFLRRRRPVPGRLELRGEDVDLRLADHDPATAVVLGRSAPEIDEKGQAEQQEVQQGFTQDPTQLQAMCPLGERRRRTRAASGPAPARV